MIPIAKENEPNELKTYRLNKKLKPTYDGMKGLEIGKFIKGGSKEILYDIVLKSLIKEQGSICAYCMRRIPQKNASPAVTIEHIIPQHQSEDDALLYENMLAVCNGNRNGGNKHMTCDAKRGSLPSNKQTMVLNPLKPGSLQNLYYKEDGEISSFDEREKEFIDGVLNLNDTAVMLPDCRKGALKGFQEGLGEKYSGHIITKDEFKALYEKYSKAEKKEPFVGIILNWLEKKMAN